MTQATRGEPEEIAGRYEILSRLGSGAFGTVYKARDRVLGRLVAIKTIRLEGLAATGIGLTELVERFEREARISAQLRHPHIVTIYDVGEAEGVSYLAMEFLDGMGLDRLVGAERRLPAERAAAIGAQVADALDYAHSKDVVHRDVKPANIMVEAGDRVKVTDFGIAKVTSATDQLTATGNLLGTPSYMSPEQARGRPLDGRSDLFSLGCVLYEMVAGVKAFEADSITGLIFKIITEPAPSLRARVPDLSEGMIRIVERAMRKDPAERYATGAELARDLGALAGGTLPDIADAPTLAVAATAPGGAPTRVAAPTPVASLPAPPTAAAGAGKPPREAAGRTVPGTSTPPRGRLRSLGLGLALVAVGAIVGVSIARRAVRRDASPPHATGTPTVPGAVPATSAAPEAPSPSESLPAPPPPPAEPSAPAAQPPGGPAETNGAGAESARRSHGPLTPEQLEERAEAAGHAPLGDGRAGLEDLGPLSPSERPTVLALRHVIGAQQAFHREHGRYASLPDLLKDRYLGVAEMTRLTLLRRSYEFRMDVAPDSFRVVATPKRPGGRGFEGDQTGRLRVTP